MFEKKCLFSEKLLGLAVIHGAVDDYKGFIEVKSSVGKGSTFSIYLPVTKEPVTEAEGVESMEKSGAMSGNERILVVDDELLLVKINQKRLEGRCYQVTAVTDSRERPLKFSSASQTTLTF